jgi:hypothetical protein
MSQVEHEAPDAELVAAYVQHAVASRSGSNTDGTFWAWEAVDQLTRRDPEALWSFLGSVLPLAADDATLAYVGAGPLEDLVVLYGHAFIDRIEVAAGADPKMLRALCAVWGRDRMAPDIADRLHRLVGKQPPL